MVRSKHAYLKLVGAVEAASLLILLFLGTPLKWLAHIPEPARILGTIHGCLFLMYVATLVSSSEALQLTRKQVLIGIGLASIPFGPFLFESRVVGE